ncbi:hypothetical protein ABXT64_05390 [Candidatus Marifrigoribacter sp. Uisw_064]|jgi:hypothetical protein|uniref:hypothetical protein n=1 Tax=Candidatus Marifrigoribacter sp. Uisw_064 TaxID=3230970 RepID=UPI003D534CBC
MGQSNSGEMDIMQIFNSLKKVLVKVVVMLFKVWNFILEKWIIIISLLIIGVLLGYFLQSSFKPNKTADVLLKVNFDAADYLYREVDLINNKIKQKDSVFLTNLGLSTDTIEVKSLKIQPVVNLKDVASKYVDESKILENLLKNVEFEGEEVVITNTFISDYKYHTITFKLSNNATLNTISSVIEYFNSNELLEKVKIKKSENLNSRIIYNTKIITQIDALIETYNSNNSISSSSNDIFVVDKNFDMDAILDKKIDLQKENEWISQELIYLDEIFVVINNPQFTKIDKELKNNKIIFYPFILVFLFLFLAFLKHLYYYLKQIAENA